MTRPIPIIFFITIKTSIINLKKKVKTKNYYKTPTKINKKIFFTPYLLVNTLKIVEFHYSKHEQCIYMKNVGIM